MDTFQFGSQKSEAGGQVPVTKDRRVVQRSWLAGERCQEVDRLKDHLLQFRPLVRGNDLALGHDRDLGDIAFDCHGLEREFAGHAITAAVEGDCLVLVHGHGRLDHAGVKALGRQSSGSLEILSQTITNDECA